MPTYSLDFETTTELDDCRVWAYGIYEIGSNNNFIFGNSLNDFMHWVTETAKCYTDVTGYFHNLKFDGEFILHWLFKNNFKWVDYKTLEPGTFTTLISDKGQFYSLTVCFGYDKKKPIIFRFYDSLKILPFSVDVIASCFNLEISKLEINYKEYRPSYHTINKIEYDYLKNDVKIVAQALKILFDEGLTKMTQGSNALADYKRIVTTKKFNKLFPIPKYDEDIRKSYRGGFTYLKDCYRDVDITEGIVLDVNSLYPSVMYFCNLPYGEGIFFDGKYETDLLYNLYVQSFTCQFELKPNHIPTIQIKNSLAFIPTQYLSSSNGEDITLCLTNVDLDLFFEHYNVYNITYHGGWKFKSTVGLFTDYIDKWSKIKIESTKNGNKAMRTLAKLMLNSLYGKFALNPIVQSKIPCYENGLVKYIPGEIETRDAIYIPVGTFITAYARHKTITSAQLLYDRFIYADTDSLHLIGTEIPIELDVDETKLGAWAHESTFTRARFLRQKTYIEEIEGEMCITCAGMPEKCYQYVTWENFHPGSSYGGKLTPKHVAGGIVLTDTQFTIKN